MAKRSRKKKASSPSPSRESKAVAEKPAVRTQKQECAGVFSLWDFLRAVVIVALGWWVFAPALHGGWIWDDLVYIANNPLSGDPNRLWKIWFLPGSFIEYYPIEETVQWAQWECFRDNTLGYHVTNLVLHLVSALLVWRLLAKLSLRLAWLGGLLFAVHPAMVESVAWMSELKNTLSLPPFLLAACAYIDYDEHGRRRDYLLSLGLFLVAMLCKISMAPFPLVILLYAWWKRGRIDWRDLKAATPFLVISLVLGITTILAGIWYRPTHHMAPDHVEVGGLLARFDLIGLLIGWYICLVVCPVTHSFFYPKWTVDPPSLLHFLTWPVLAIVIGYLWSRRWTWGRHVLLGLGFFFLNLAPFLGFTAPSYMGFSWAMDHFLYLPIIGLIGLAVAGLEQIDVEMPATVRPWGVGVVTLAMMGLAWSSHRYAETFASEVALWTHTVECDPGSETAHADLGTALMRQSRFEEAVVQFKLAAQLNPLDQTVHDTLGQTLAQMGRLQEAMTEFDKAIEINPRDTSPFANRGHLWQIMGNSERADADFSRAIALNPDLPQPYINRSALRQVKGDWSGAMSDLQKYCRLAPSSPNADYARFWIWFIRVQHGQEAEADRELADALAHHWNGAPGQWSSQIGRFLLGQITEKAFLAAAAAPTPDRDRSQHCEAWYYAGMIRLLSGDKAAAKEYFQKSLATGDDQSLPYSLAQGQLKMLEAH